MFGLGRTVKKVLNIITCLMAFLTIFLLAFLYANTIFHFNLSAEVLEVLYVIKKYAVLAVVILVGFEFVVTKGLVLTIIYCVFAGIVVIFSFFPEVSAQISGALACLPLLN